LVQKLALLGFLIISTALVASIAGAQSLNATVNSQLLESAMSQINCKTNFTVTFGNYISASLSNSNSIYPKIVALQQENAQLQNYSASANIAGFRTYVREYYDPSLKQIGMDVLFGLKGSRLAQGTTKTLREEYNQTQSAYNACEFNTEKQLAIAKGDAYEYYISYYNQKVQNLSAEGLNTTAMQSLVNKAQAEIVVPYMDDVNASTNQSALDAALSRYCLFDDCRNGTNFHLAANFDVLKLTAIYDKLSAIPDLTGKQTAQLANIRADLNVTSAALGSVGTNAYTQGSGQAIFNDLNATVMNIRALRKS
jgi:hypothetical protein